MTPQHCFKPMYRDVHDGEDMRRWLCAEPGCECVLSDTTLAALQEMSWADRHGILLPGVTIVGGGAPTRTGSTNAASL